MNVGMLAKPDVVMLEPGASIIKAAQLMRKHHVGSIVVVKKDGNNTIPIGIITDRDIVVEIVAEEVPIGSVSIEQVMSFDLITVRETEDVWSALQRMRSSGVRRIPVVDYANNIVGVLSADDILEMLAERLTDLSMLIIKEQSYESDKRSEIR